MSDIKNNLEKKFVYADNSATTCVDKKIIEIMQQFLNKQFGNPSSLYSFSRVTEQAIQNSRKKVAKVLNCLPEEIYFTSGGSESNNWAIKGTCMAKVIKSQSKEFSNLHIITSKIEHHSVLNTVKFLEKLGTKVTYLDVDSDGIVNPKSVESAIRENTVLVSIIYANNEVGTIQNISEIGKICKKHKVLFHTDAVQAIGAEKIDVNSQNIDLLSISAHKFYGPKGIGALYIKKGTLIENLIHGGAQERSKRAGTENVAEIVGFGEAIEMAYENFEEKKLRLISLRDKMIESFSKIDKSKLNGHRTQRLPNNINFCFEGIEGESLIMKLDRNYGICASSGSACTSGNLEPSHVLIALGLPHEIAHGSLRISLGKNTTDEEIDYICQKVQETVENLRKLSPIWKN